MPVLRQIRRLSSRTAVRVGGLTVALGLVAFAGQASFTSSGPTSYVVRQGDSLWSIASAHHLTVSQLEAANGLSPSRVLLIGTHLTIPASGSAAATTAAVTSTASSATGGTSFCSTFSFPAGSEPLPSGLTANPSRLALRPLFVQWAEAYGVSPSLLEAVAWQESGWQEGAVSSASAVGVGQLLPSTASFVSEQLIGSPLQISSASDNIRMAARYLAYLQSATGSECSTIAAYNEGLANLRAHGVLPEVVPYVRSVASIIPEFS